MLVQVCKTKLKIISRRNVKKFISDKKYLDRIWKKSLIKYEANKNASAPDSMSL